MTGLLLFSDRLKLADEYDEWREANGVLDCPLSVVTWLHLTGLLDLEEIRKHKMEKKEEGR